MPNTPSEIVTDWIKRIQEAIEPYLHQIPYGNLRSEYSRWDDTDDGVTNLAIVYEVPGGSTNQLNITYNGAARTFTYIALDSHEEQCTDSLDSVRRMVEEAIMRIPAIRRNRLVEDIDRWAAQGLTQRDLFQKMNLLLQIEDLRGGTITMHEMKYGIQYILANYRTPAY